MIPFLDWDVCDMTDNVKGFALSLRKGLSSLWVSINELMTYIFTLICSAGLAIISINVTVGASIMSSSASMASRPL